MNKKLLYSIFAIIVLLGAAALIWFFTIKSDPKPPTKSGIPLSAMSIKQAFALSHTATCSSNNQSIKASVESLPGLGENSGIYTEEIYDVPAGTNVDVSISAYVSSSDTVTGSLAYSNEYGNYNFMLQKQNDVWRYVAFIRCG